MNTVWQTKLLADVSSISYGHTESASEEPIGPKFLRITDIQNDRVDWDSVPYCKIDPADLPRYRLERGDIVFARTGATTGKSYLINGVPEAVFASYLIRLRLRDRTIDPKFVSYFFQTDTYWDAIKAGSTGSAQGGFNATKLGALGLPVPPLAEQQHVVAILDKAFSAIATAKANTEKNLLNARALFRHQLDKLLRSESRDTQVRRLGDVCTFINGRAYSKDELLERGKYPVLRVGNFFTNDHWYYSDLELDPDKYCDSGDLLYAWSASFGPRIWTGPKVIYHYHIWKVVPNRETISKGFLKYLLEWDVQQVKQAHGTGTTMTHVGKASMENRRLPIPPLADQREIENSLEQLNQRAVELQSGYKQKLTVVEDLKNSILSRAFSGNL